MQVFTAHQYLKIDIASKFGLDKEVWDKRLEWFDAHEHELEELVDQADDKCGYQAAVIAWRSVQAGNPTGHLVALDATSSGAQIAAALFGDTKTAKFCNVFDVGYRVNLYRELADLIKERLKSKGVDGIFIDSLSYYKIKNKAIVPAFYFSKAEPAKTFNVEHGLESFNEIMQENLPCFSILGNIVKKCWDPKAAVYTWLLPDNFHAIDRVHTTVTEEITVYGKTSTFSHKHYGPANTGRSLGANLIHSVDGFYVREMGRRCNYDQKRIRHVRNIIENKDEFIDLIPEQNDNTQMLLTLWSHYKESKFLSARILDYITEDNVNLIDTDVVKELLDSLPKKPFKVVTIHDSFQCHANYANDLRKQYINLLALTWKSDMLVFILRRMFNNNKINLKKFNHDAWVDVYNSEYALC